MTTGPVSAKGTATASAYAAQFGTDAPVLPVSTTGPTSVNQNPGSNVDGFAVIAALALPIGGLLLVGGHGRRTHG